MTALLTAIGLLAFAWLLHLAWWRIRIPTRHTQALLAVFCATPPVAALLWLALGLAAPISVYELPAVALLYLVAVPCYLVVYTAVEESSPSLSIMRALQTAGARGCSREELSGVITEDNFIKPRLDALRRDGFVTSVAGGSVLTTRGRMAVRIAVLVSRVFNVSRNA